ncbi:ABC transporter permease [Oleiagrimonas sp.]|jgi:putative ABC transport system permease protein|uniref:ABC transporter permease n=1 Tax=Oleiagrimonas sp. TaxID=2010330 RepID=UPI0026343BAB|nr:ABC transporter permease [Oleiagrimonas sp.]MDA3912927.1 ABC transporter permease [Oleiagrimonas sp.]
MFGYYLDLALRSLKRNKVLTALMVLALALGIGASITTLTVLRLLSGDPLPQKSAQLYYPQVDPRPAQGFVAGKTRPMPTLTYTDAMNLLKLHKARHQAVMALTHAKVMPVQGSERPFFSDAVMTTSDFFPMFDVPFRYGSGWSARDGEAHARVVVISDTLNQKLFGGANSVGRTLRISSHDFRVAGVLAPWSLQPRFYAVRLGGRSYGDGDGVFLPLQTALADKMRPSNLNCYDTGDLSKLKRAPCVWLGMWVDLPTASQARAYRSFLANYVRQQMALGRLHRPETAMPDLMQWLRQSQVVPDDVRLQAWIAFGFLLICVVNTVGLLLAKCLRRSQEIGVRRALGATRRTVFAQFMVEAGIIGLAGGLLGLAFAELGLWGIRHQPAQYAGLAHLDLSMFAFTFVVALVSSMIAGVLPAWRACVLAPAPQLKAS